jgi:SAM-dependent methyltransferase
MPGGQFWDRYVQTVGHTSYRDAFIRRYDRPLRLRAIKKHVDMVQTEHPETSDALDFGCGEGDITDLLRKDGWSVSGVDVSPEILAIARERFVDDPKVRMIQSDPDNFPPELGKYDLCTIVDVLQNVQDDDSVVALLSGIRGHMKPHGRVLTLEIATSERLMDPNAQMKERTPEEWRGIYRAAGFEVEKETVYALSGITLLQQFDRVLGRLLGGMGSSAPDEPNETRVLRPGLRRRIARLGLGGIRRGILIGMWPIDYVFRISAPRRWALHRFFILKLQD